MRGKTRLAVLGSGVAALALFAVPARADESNKQTTFHFSGPIEVPGHVLGPGTYIFRLEDQEGGRDVVQIFSKDNRGIEHVVTTLIAVPDYRVHTFSEPVLMFEERRHDAPKAVRSWFYPGDNYGWDFQYRGVPR